MTRPAALRPFVALLVALALVVAGVGSPSAAVEDPRLSAFEATKAVLTAPERAPKQAGASCVGTGNAVRPVQASEPPRVPCTSIGRLPEAAGPEGARRTILKEARAPPRKAG